MEGLIFKGGTCLAKIHAGFHRLSEDLDFGVSTRADATRAERSKLASGFKQAVLSIRDFDPALAVKSSPKGAAASSQYLAEFAYLSLIHRHQEGI